MASGHYAWDTARCGVIGVASHRLVDTLECVQITFTGSVGSSNPVPHGCLLVLWPSDSFKCSLWNIPYLVNNL